jgi:sugar phosphate isomerase/epimerase
MLNRRQLFTQSSLALLGSSSLYSIEPLQRKPRFSGLSLTTYSLLRHMKYFRGKINEKGALDMLQFLDYAVGQNLDAVEITSYFFELPVKPAYVNAMKRRAYLHGLDISGAAMGNNFTYDPGSDEAKKELETTKHWIDIFADLGAPSIRVFAGRPAKGMSEEQTLKHVLANLEPALAHAEKRGIMLGMENHDTTSNVDVLLKVVKAVKSEWFGVVWDSANLTTTPDPYAELARIAPYAITAQIKVMVRVNGKNEPADYKRLLEILWKANYRGYIVLEYEEPEDPYEAIPVELNRLREALSTYSSK